LAPTPLEVSESIDMLRLIEHGIRVRLVPTAGETHAVDTPEDLEVVAARLVADPFTATYL
jgi:3-deoxy-manno-octulosonate cytidylyltransferase (CMP-KDO synthetase)